MMLGRLLCWLGLHQVVITRPATMQPAVGHCVRCPKSYEWTR